MRSVQTLLALVASCQLASSALTQSPDDSQAFNPSYTGNVFSSSEGSVSCLSCGVTGNLSFTAGEYLLTGPAPPNFDLLNGPDFSLTSPWTAVAFDSFDVHIELAIDLTPTSPTHEIDYKFLTLDFPWELDGTGVNLTFTAEMHGWLNTSVPANITYGFDIIVPAGAVVFFSTGDSLEPQTAGFNGTTINPTNFTSSTPNLVVDFELSFRPGFYLNGEIFDETIASASVYADIPKLDLTISSVSNVTSTCDPAPLSLSKDQVFKNLTHLVPTVTSDLVFTFDSAETNFTLLPPISLPTSCYEYFPKTKELGAPVAGSQSAAESVRSAGLMMVVLGSVVAFWM